MTLLFKPSWRTRVRLAWHAITGNIWHRDTIAQLADAWRYPGAIGEARERFYLEYSSNKPDLDLCRDLLQQLEDVLGFDDPGLGDLRWLLETEDI